MTVCGRHKFGVAIDLVVTPGYTNISRAIKVEGRVPRRSLKEKFVSQMSHIFSMIDNISRRSHPNITGPPGRNREAEQIDRVETGSSGADEPAPIRSGEDWDCDDGSDDSGQDTQPEVRRK